MTAPASRPKLFSNTNLKQILKFKIKKKIKDFIRFFYYLLCKALEFKLV